MIIHRRRHLLKEFRTEYIQDFIAHNLETQDKRRNFF